MKIAIKNPAPLGANLAKWGDYHFGLALQSALEAAGVDVVQHFWPEWHRDDGADIVLVLRGKRRYDPLPGKLSLLWVLSHPSTVTLEEIDRYDVVYVASSTHRALLNGASQTPIRVLRQCTDTSMFTPPAPGGEDERRDVIFVANSRGVRRDMLTWALDAGVKPAIVGRHWRRLELSSFVKREYIDNDELPAFYRSARLSLNDHWGDMRHFGVINNRIFDCLACGLPVLTDDFPELRDVCGDALLYATDAASCWAAIRRYTLRYPDLLERTERLWGRLRGEYGFQARAEEIISDVRGLAPRTRAVSSYLGPSAPSLLQEMTRVLLAHQANRDGGRELEMLHVHPTPAGTEYLSTRPGLSYLSGGYGPGPWHIGLCKDAAQVPDERFDAILLEEASALDEMDGLARANFLRALVNRVRASGGMLGVLAGDRTPAWIDMLTALNLTLIAESGRWVIATRQPDKY